MSVTEFMSPAPFEAVQPLAHVCSGRRSLSWTLPSPDGGVFERNAFVWLWATVSEERMLSGEPSMFTCERRVGENHVRTPLTDAARIKLRQTMCGAVARYGFDRLWTELAASTATVSVEQRRQSAATARRRADWFDRCAELAELMAAGALDFAPVQRDPSGRLHQVRVAGYDRDWVSAEPLAKALLGAEHVGWLTGDGLVPVETVG